jgi:Lon protease-like protein
MQQGLLPLFPLNVVLLPGGQLPLHIFEERYKEMIGESLREATEFGVVLASEKGIANTGCTATIDRVLRTYEDGRLDILTVGKRRFEILLVNEERNFLRGAVEFFDDDEGVDGAPEPEGLRERAIDIYTTLRAVAADKPFAPPDAALPQLSFHLAQAVTDLGFRQTLLALRSEAERLRHFTEFLPAYIDKERRLQAVREAAPRNGHHHPH